jgi:ABC-type dipeptide/oligopeptide/nickel transport system permease component
LGLYILRRAVYSIPTLLLAVTLVFFAFQLIPGDAARMFAGDQAPVEVVERLRREMGLDRPVWEQYVTYLGRLAQGNLGTSFITGRPVTVEIADRFWNTVTLAFLAIAVATVLGLSMGIISAVKRETFWDYLLSVISLVGLSIPVFWLALLLMLLFSIQLGLLPTSGNDTWRHYIMPTFTLAVYSIAFINRMTRSSLLEMLGKDFARTARAKGLPETAVLMRHIFRNALIPIVTVVGLRFGYMLGGAVITETIFAWPGMGRLLVTAVSQRDIPVVQGVLLVVATMFILVNLLIDILYAVIDPRIEYR